MFSWPSILKHGWFCYRWPGSTATMCCGLRSHKGPILTVANWSGQWPGLVGLLNLNGSLIKAGTAFSSSGARTLPTITLLPVERMVERSEDFARRIACEAA